MKNDHSYLTLPLKFVAVIWIVFAVDTLLPGISFCEYGILPRTLKGLFGIPLSPFIHAGFGHIMSNTVPLLVLLSITTLYFKNKTYYILIIIIILGGALVCLFGRASYHVGASGLVYGLAGFLVFFGIYERKVIPLIISIFVACTYGISMLIGLLPVFPGVSWEGHLFGAVAGVLTAKVIHNTAHGKG